MLAERARDLRHSADEELRRRADRETEVEILSGPDGQRDERCTSLKRVSRGGEEELRVHACPAGCARGASTARHSSRDSPGDRLRRRGLSRLALIHPCPPEAQTSPKEHLDAPRVIILGVIGAPEIYDAAKGKPVGAATIGWVAASLIMAGLLGVLRALTVRMWRTPRNSALTRGTLLTAGLWIVPVAVRFALQVGIAHDRRVRSLQPAVLRGITLGAQREVLRVRAAGIAHRPQAAQLT